VSVSSGSRSPELHLPAIICVYYSDSLEGLFKKASNEVCCRDTGACSNGACLHRAGEKEACSISAATGCTRLANCIVDSQYFFCCITNSPPFYSHGVGHSPRELATGLFYLELRSFSHLFGDVRRERTCAERRRRNKRFSVYS